MDHTLLSIARYASAQRWESLPDSVATQAKSVTLDALGCGLGGLDGPPAQIARKLLPASDPESTGGGVAFGSGPTGSADLAAFANTCAIRFLDFNDFYPGGHPSDMLGAMLALGARPGVTGRAFLTGVVVAYEVSMRLADATQLREKGWDQGYAIGLGSVAGLGAMLGYDEATIRDALAITAVSNIPLRNTRAGLLSMWKGAATAAAVRNATFAIQLAGEGMTGPDDPIEGRHGLWDLVTGRFTLDHFPVAEEDFRILRTSFKPWPVEYNATAAVAAAVQLREKVSLQDVEKISIGTHWSSWHEIGSDPLKWDPRTRETADHSMPYLFTRAMLDGTITEATYEPESYLDPVLRPLMQRIGVHLDDESEKAFPEHIRLAVSARTRTGETHHVLIVDPPGHWRNPLTGDQLREKFLGLVTPVLGEAEAGALAAFWLSVEEHDELVPGLVLSGASMPVVQ
ncbi:MmgE/PrpD family protein [Herbiconiux sp.]|uniref:MmgE/PrpD family protein n=1 Tax=Herbiconiux sp. TaxID=1871186 RepID=UPI0025BFCBBA|nr:MmgE/PrpD family protein [Herbiconiux sp.]